MKPFSTSRWCKHFETRLVKPGHIPVQWQRASLSCAVQCKICGSEIMMEDFFHALDSEVTAPPPSRSLHHRLLGHHATASEVTSPPLLSLPRRHILGHYITLSSSRSLHHHLQLQLRPLALPPTPLCHCLQLQLRSDIN
jgi:hypothetical protein